MTHLVGEEMHKVTDQFSQNSKILDKKFAALYKELDIDKMNRLIERKMGRDDAVARFEQGEQKAKTVSKAVHGLQGTVKRIEDFVDNLGLAVRNLEAANLKGGINSTNISSYIKQQQLSSSGPQAS